MKGAIDTARLTQETVGQMIKDKALTAVQNEAVTQAGINNQKRKNAETNATVAVKTADSVKSVSTA